jgi:hypothetical protein
MPSARSTGHVAQRAGGLARQGRNLKTKTHTFTNLKQEVHQITSLYIRHRMLWAVLASVLLAHADLFLALDDGSARKDGVYRSLRSFRQHSQAPIHLFSSRADGCPAEAVEGLHVIHGDEWETKAAELVRSNEAGRVLVASAGELFFQADPFALQLVSNDLLVVGKQPAVDLVLGPAAIFHQLLTSAPEAGLLNWLSDAANQVQTAAPNVVAGQILTLDASMDVEINMFNDVVNESGEPYTVLCQYQQHRLVSDALTVMPAINSPRTSHKIVPKTGVKTEHVFSNNWQEYTRTHCTGDPVWTPDGAAQVCLRLLQTALI